MISWVWDNCHHYWLWRLDTDPWCSVWVVTIVMEPVLILAIDGDQPRVQEVLLLTRQHDDTSVTCYTCLSLSLLPLWCVTTELCLDSVSSSTRLSTPQYHRLSWELWRLHTGYAPAWYLRCPQLVLYWHNTAAGSLQWDGLLQKYILKTGCYMLRDRTTQC